MEEGAEAETLQLCVRNTFLHVKDVDDEARKLHRSRSDSSIPSSTSSGSHSSSRSTPISSKSQQEDSQSLHVVDGAPAWPPANRSSSSSDFIGSEFGQEEHRSDIAPQSGMLKGPIWSSGAAFHQHGQCRPCAWHWKPTGCANGVECQFCHMCDEGAVHIRRRENVAKRKALRKVELAEALSKPQSAEAKVTSAR